MNASRAPEFGRGAGEGIEQTASPQDGRRSHRAYAPDWRGAAQFIAKASESGPPTPTYCGPSDPPDPHPPAQSRVLGSQASAEATIKRATSGRAPAYGRVVFSLRARLGLTTNEYLLCDIVMTLSRKTGWCFASRGYLAALLGISTRSLQRLLGSLVAEGLLEIHASQPRQLRPTEHWWRAIASAAPGHDGSGRGDNLSPVYKKRYNR